MKGESNELLAVAGLNQEVAETIDERSTIPVAVNHVTAKRRCLSLLTEGKETESAKRGKRKGHELCSLSLSLYYLISLSLSQSDSLSDSLSLILSLSL